MKYLGIYLNLNWNEHTNALPNKLARSIFAIRNLRGLVIRFVLLTTYYALFGSYLGYGLLVWGQTPTAKRMFELQRKVVRIISGPGFRNEVRQEFIELWIV